MKKIKNIKAEQMNEEISITFDTAQYPGILFELVYTKNELKTYGWNLINNELTERKKKNANKWVEKNQKTLFDYFKHECLETKMLFLYL